MTRKARLFRGTECNLDESFDDTRSRIEKLTSDQDLDPILESVQNIIYLISAKTVTISTSSISRRVSLDKSDIDDISE